ncbi:integrase arm-type DNA-binding domain-containing protein [Halopseudomonas sp. Lyrl_26]|uniref:tyrosine-type recombinase/integrase n=1 Tax=Halopseudomonas sp. Lyrl_26 TaxID=3110923 RepID=UPI0030DB1FB8|tara:strand:- start:6079 stop:7311 length:1233 start_codon:yes stop_codon:yes gene_type:complete
MGSLTAKSVEKLIRTLDAGMHNDGDGLYLRIRKTGSSSWIYRYRFNSKLRDMGLGSYPEVSLAEARGLAAEARKLARTGTDPLEERQKQREELEAEKIRQAAQAITFQEVAQDYIEAHRPGWKNVKHAGQWVSTLQTYAYPKIGHLPPSEVSTEHVLEILKPIWTKIPETASRVRNRIELVLDAAKATGLREGENPARWRGHLDKLLPKRSKVSKVRHHPALPWTEASRFMKELAQQTGLAYRALEMTILTCCRTSEVLGAQWSEIDLKTDTWTIPAERMKADKEHRVPITAQLKSLLEQLPRVDNSPYLFPGQKKGQPLSNMSMLMGLRRMGYSHITVHGFRSTFRDWAGENTAHPRDVCEQALAHTLDSAVESAYRRGDMFEKRQKLMEDWANYLDKSDQDAQPTSSP